METTELFSFIKDFGFPVVLSWFLLVRMENKLINPQTGICAGAKGSGAYKS